MTIDHDIAAAKRDLATAEANGDDKAAREAQRQLGKLHKSGAAEERAVASPSKSAAPAGRASRGERQQTVARNSEA